MLSLAVRNTARLETLVTDIMDYSKIVAGKLKVEKEACDPRDLMRDATESLRAMALAPAMAAGVYNVGSGRSVTLQRLAAIAFPTTGGMAIPYQPEASELHANSWCSMFAYQALHLAQSSRPLNWQFLL